MNRILSLLAVSLIASSTANVINYHIDLDSDNEVVDCVEKAMEVMMESTCLFFRQSSQEEATVFFIQSSHCAWQKDNSTVHLSSSCVDDDVCFELVGRVLSVEQPKAHMTRQLNLDYNCTEKCTIDCKHGGIVQDDCSCKCGYGFKGESCEELSKEASFTDEACGIIQASDKGHIALSTYPGDRPKTTFCQWLIRSDDPWTVIDAEIEHLGLDDVDVSPGLKCNDLFTVYGTEDINSPIPCDNSANVTQLHSTNNWLLLELRSNSYSDHSFKGPSIRYSTRKVQPGVRIFSEGMTASASSLVPAAFVLAVLRLF